MYVISCKLLCNNEQIETDLMTEELEKVGLQRRKRDGLSLPVKILHEWVLAEAQVAQFST